MRAAFIRFRNFVYVVILAYLGYKAYIYFSGSNEAKCAHKSVIKTVHTILKQTAMKAGDMTQDDFEKLDMKLTNIVTLDKNSVGSYFCQATLTMKYNGKDSTHTIKYNNRVVESDEGNYLTTITDIR